VDVEATQDSNRQHDGEPPPRHPENYFEKPPDLLYGEVPLSIQTILTAIIN